VVQQQKNVHVHNISLGGSDRHCNSNNNTADFREPLTTHTHAYILR